MDEQKVGNRVVMLQSLALNVHHCAEKGDADGVIAWLKELRRKVDDVLSEAETGRL